MPAFAKLLVQNDVSGGDNNKNRSGCESSLAVVGGVSGGCRTMTDDFCVYIRQSSPGLQIGLPELARQGTLNENECTSKIDHENSSPKLPCEMGFFSSFKKQGKLTHSQVLAQR